MHNDNIEIPLPKGYITIVDKVDGDLAIPQIQVRKPPTSGPYAFINLPSPKLYYPIDLHKIILERILGRPLVKGELVDHKDGNTLNNRRNNLRLADKRKNATNSKKRVDNKSGFKGVCWSIPGNRWRAYGKKNGKQVHLGYFDTPEEAHNAYRKFAEIEYGEFARYE